MTGPATSEIAREVDRLVIGVHRGVMSLHRSRLQEMVESIGVTSPGHLYDLAEFLAVGACTVEIARRRFRYEPNNAAEALISSLLNRQLVDDQLRPSQPLAEVIATILLWQAETAANLWGSDLATANRGAAEALRHTSGPMVEAFRSLPDPTQPAHCLHHRLTGLRYARLDAHIAAWEEVELMAGEIVALTAAVASDTVSPTPGGLVARRWLTIHGTVTPEGLAARAGIEAETDARCDALFEMVRDRGEWVAALRALPPTDEPRLSSERPGNTR